MAPEAEMPIAPSLAVPAHPGSGARPAANEITPARPPAPTKVLSQDQRSPWQAVPTRTTPPAASWVPEAVPTTAKTRPIIRRSRVVVLAATVVALLALAAAWALWRPVVRDVARPSSSATTEVEAPPPSAAAAAPVATGPAIAEPTHIRAAAPANRSADSAGERGRTARSKIGKPREVAEPSDRTKNSPKPGVNNAPRTGKW